MNQFLIGIMGFYYFYIIFLAFVMFKRRKDAIVKKEMDYKYFSDYQGNIPNRVAVAGNHFNNQFQVPILFYIACVISIQMNKVDSLCIILAMAFVISRFAHSFIHLGINKPILRAKVYLVGLLIVGVMFFRAAL